VPRLNRDRAQAVTTVRDWNRDSAGKFNLFGLPSPGQVQVRLETPAEADHHHHGDSHRDGFKFRAPGRRRAAAAAAVAAGQRLRASALRVGPPGSESESLEAGTA
jgi:hypothetical protein